MQKTKNGERIMRNIKERLREFIPVVKNIDNDLFNGFLRRTYKICKDQMGKKKSFFKHKWSVVLREPVADMILMQNSQQESQFNQYQAYDFAVRYLALDEYYHGKGDGFKLYEKMHTVGGNYGQRNDVEKRYEAARRKGRTPVYGGGREQHSIEQFTNLIQSVDEIGYREDSYIMADRNLLSMNGSHRLVLAFYKEIDCINVEVHNRLFQRRYSEDFFWENGFAREEIACLNETMSEILKEAKKRTGYYYCILFPPAEKYFDDITEDIGKASENNISVIKYDDYEWELPDFFGFLKGVYYFDSILPSNFERKLLYILRASDIRQNKVKFRIVTIDIKNPMYRLKKDNGMPESVATVRLKNMIRERYKVKEKKFTEKYSKGYAHDVIIHSSDNFMSNRAFRDLLDINRDLTRVMEIMGNFSYAMSVISEDKVSREFPQNYYMGEDFDIFVEIKDLDEITQVVNDACRTIFSDSWTDTVVEDSPFGKRVRVTYNGFTLTMFDFMTQFPGILQNYISKFIRECEEFERHGVKLYKLSTEHELIYRTDTFLRSTSKMYHKEFLVSHRDMANTDNILKAFDDKTYQKAQRLWNNIKSMS